MLLMSALIFDLDVLGGTSDILYVCLCCGSSHWFLTLNSRVLTGTPSHLEGGTTYQFGVDFSYC